MAAGADGAGEGRTAHEVHGGEGELVLDAVAELLVIDHELRLVPELVRHMEEYAVLQLCERRPDYSGKNCSMGRMVEVLT